MKEREVEEEKGEEEEEEEGEEEEEEGEEEEKEEEEMEEIWKVDKWVVDTNTTAVWSIPSLYSNASGSLQSTEISYKYTAENPDEDISDKHATHLFPLSLLSHIAQYAYWQGKIPTPKQTQCIEAVCKA